MVNPSFKFLFPTRCHQWSRSADILCCLDSRWAGPLAGGCGRGVRERIWGQWIWFHGIELQLCHLLPMRLRGWIDTREIMMVRGESPSLPSES